MVVIRTMHSTLLLNYTALVIFFEKNLKPAEDSKNDEHEPSFEPKKKKARHDSVSNSKQSSNTGGNMSSSKSNSPGIKSTCAPSTNKSASASKSTKHDLMDIFNTK